MKPLLMMRTKGVSGPQACSHQGVPGLSKSIGNAVGHGGPLSAPTWLVMPVQDVSQGGAWSIDLNHFCVAGVTYAVNSGALPTGITLNAHGTFSGTVTDASGSGSVSFAATNPNGVSISSPLLWTIP